MDGKLDPIRKGIGSHNFRFQSFAVSVVVSFVDFHVTLSCFFRQSFQQCLRQRIEIITTALPVFKFCSPLRGLSLTHQNQGPRVGVQDCENASSREVRVILINGRTSGRAVRTGALTRVAVEEPAHRFIHTIRQVDLRPCYAARRHLDRGRVGNGARG